MIQKLRWKFVRVTMSAVLAVLLLIVLAINAVNIWQSDRALDAVTQLLLESGGTFQKYMDGPGPDGPAPERRDGPRFKMEGGERFHPKEMPFAARFFTVTLDEGREITGWDLRSIASVTEDDVGQIAASILARRRGTGWYQSYRYRVGETQDGFLIIALEATETRSAVLSVLAITLAVGLAALLAVFALIVPLSRRAVRPISETYQKQRQFITDASHELKTPLTVISANAEVLGMTCGENEWSRGILRQCERMRALIGEMIQMSRLDEGKAAMSAEEFDLSEAVYDTAMSFQSPARTRGLALSVDVQPQLRLTGDEGAARQLVSILMDNAVKYCDAGGRVSAALRREGRGRLELSVSNTFAAAASLETDKLFERFYRADPAHTEGSGYGLGLPIARSIAEAHRGSLRAERPEEGVIRFTAILKGR